MREPQRVEVIPSQQTSSALRHSVTITCCPKQSDRHRVGGSQYLHFMRSTSSLSSAAVRCHTL